MSTSLQSEERGWIASACSVALLLLAATGSDLYAQSSAGYSLDDWMTVNSVRSFIWAPSGDAVYFTARGEESGVFELYRKVLPDGDWKLIEAELPETPVEPDRPDPKENVVLGPDGEEFFFTAARYFAAYANIYSVPVAGGQAERITFNNAVIETDPSPSPEGDELAYFAHERRGTEIHLMNLEGDNNWSRTFTPDVVGDRHPSWSPDGSRLLYRRDGRYWLYDFETGEERRVIDDTMAGHGQNGGAVWSPSGDRIAFLNDRSGYSQVAVADIESGSVTSITHQEPVAHSDVTWSPDGEQLAFVRSDSDGLSEQIAVAAADGSGEVTVLTEGEAVRSSPKYSPQGDAIGFLKASDTRTQDVWAVDLESGSTRQITNSMGAIDPGRLSSATEVYYPGPDSLPIPTLVYKPQDFDSSREYPVIVRIHGHPGQWDHDFELERQYLIQKGYVVVAVNPRGSAGFGPGFHDLHIGDYGGTELKDVLGVLDYLESLEYIDMSRKATWGGSGGGYLSLMIATHAPEAFQAQIIRAPVSSWKLLAIDRYGGSGRFWQPTREVVRERSEFGGSYSEIPEEYEMRSPINFVANVTVPQLLMQGLRDSAVPPRQSQNWAEKMREEGKEELINYVEYPSEDHGLDRYRGTVRDRIERMTSFLASHLGEN